MRARRYFFEIGNIFKRIGVLKMIFIQEKDKNKRQKQMLEFYKGLLERKEAVINHLINENEKLKNELFSLKEKTQSLQSLNEWQDLQKDSFMRR